MIARDPTAVSSGKYSGLNDVCDESKTVGAPAVWWSPKGAGSVDCVHGPDVVLLEGEMHLEPDLLPSCEVPFLLASVRTFSLPRLPLLIPLFLSVCRFGIHFTVARLVCIARRFSTTFANNADFTPHLEIQSILRF